MTTHKPTKCYFLPLALLLCGCSPDIHQHDVVPSSSDFPSPLAEVASSRTTARTFAPFKRLKYGMRAPAIAALVGRADKVPQDLTVASYHLTDGSVVELWYDAYLFGAEHVAKDGKRHTFIDEKQRHIAPIARTLAPFKHLKVGMDHLDYQAIVGKAIKDEGNELDFSHHNYCYKLSDGSLVWIGYHEDSGITSVRHQLKNGQMVNLISAK